MLQNPKKNAKTPKILKGLKKKEKTFYLANRGDKLFDQKSPVYQERGFQERRNQPTENRQQTDIVTELA